MNKYLLDDKILKKSIKKWKIERNLNALQEELAEFLLTFNTILNEKELNIDNQSIWFEFIEEFIDCIFMVQIIFKLKGREFLSDIDKLNDKLEIGLNFYINNDIERYILNSIVMANHVKRGRINLDELVEYLSNIELELFKIFIYLKDNILTNEALIYNIYETKKLKLRIALKGKK